MPALEHESFSTLLSIIAAAIKIAIILRIFSTCKDPYREVWKRISK